MSQGTLYIFSKSPRSNWLGQLVSELELDISVEGIENDKFAANFPLKKAPAFIDNSGWKLTETIAIIQYLISLKESSSLAGNSTKEKAQVLKWLSLFNHDFIDAAVEILFFAKTDADKKLWIEKGTAILSYADAFLKYSKLLAADSITIADIFVYKVIISISPLVGGIEPFKNINRWIADVESIAPAYK
ncbi:hypothetical protein DAMA08_036620 [Martiniozyma asiatica (nom. inval.)]|nr:hypothetical protein DAMA08_036620 [Martiniozyma asiatica]